MHAPRPPKGLLLTVTTLVAGIFGACVGFVFGLSTPMLNGADGAFLWALGWTAIGAVQGGSSAAAFHLRAPALLPACRLIIAASGLLTSLTALGLWRALGAGAGLSLAMAAGLGAMCAAPLGARLLSRRRFAPALPI